MPSAYRRATIRDQACQDLLVDLDAVLSAFTGHEPRPRWVDSDREHLAPAEWRRVLHACQAAVRTHRQGLGPRTVAQATAVETVTAPNHVRIAVALVLASRSAKQEIHADLGTYWHELEAADRLGAELRPAPQRRRPAMVRCERLPVEEARAVPILDLLGRYGVTCRRVGREYLGRCPFGDHRRPHLSVNPQKNVWRCWPCDLGGDGIAFVMRLKGLNFAEATREVAA